MQSYGHRRIERGFLEDLEVGHFDVNLYGSRLAATEDRARFRALLYGVFYRIVLAPNQAFDLALVHEKPFNPTRPSRWPFILTVDADLLAQHPTKPFRAQLLRFLRRPPPNTWSLASKYDSSRASHAWAELLTMGRLLEASDIDVLREARHVWGGELGERARKLDSSIRTVRPQPYSTGSSTRYRDVYENLVIQHLLPETIPQTRSAAWTQIQNVAGGNPTVVEELRVIPDAVSTVVYSMGTQSRLVIAANSKVADHTFGVPKNKGAYVEIDLSGLIANVPSLNEALHDLDWDRYWRAVGQSEELIAAAWDFTIRSEGTIGWRRRSARKFENGLRRFLEVFLGERAPSGILAMPEARLSVELSQSPKLTFDFKPQFRDGGLLKGLGKFIHVKSRH